MDRPNGGFEREFSCANGIEVQQAPMGRSQPDRQEEDWSTPNNVERRENDLERRETPRDPPPPAPPPEDRLFTDWSSIDSPRERASQCNVSARSVEPNITQIVNQTEQPRLESARNEAIGNTLSDVTTVTSTHQQLSQVGTTLIDRETNMSEVELRSQREETRINILSGHDRDVQMPTSHSGISSQETDIIRGSPVRTCTTDIIPQLDGPTSVRTRRRLEQEPIQRTTVRPRRGYHHESDSDSHDNRRPHDGRRPSGRRRRYHNRSGGLPDRGNNHNRGYSRSGGPPDDGELPDDGGPPRNGRNPRHPGRQGPPGPPGPPGPVRPIIVQQPQVTLDTTALENTFGTVGQSMLQLAMAQDQINRHLQQHLQQGQLNMQVHAGALQQLATSTYQHNFDHIFASIPIYDGSDREGFFPWLELLEAACFYNG